MPYTRRAIYSKVVPKSDFDCEDRGCNSLSNVFDDYAESMYNVLASSQYLSLWLRERKNCRGFLVDHRGNSTDSAVLRARGHHQREESSVCRRKAAISHEHVPWARRVGKRCRLQKKT